ncbi:MAG: DUF6261 family protein [Odoribacteraceae bacterium]|jgi:hypothetical protein|nr:DUF6261 family protein [Odoribacteraceae bacterium]
MKHLKNMPVYQMRNETIVRAAQDVYDLIKKLDADALDLMTLFTALGQLLAKVSGSLDQPDKSAITANLKRQDRARDNAVRSLLMTIRGLLTHPDPVKRDAAERLMVLVGGYGNFTRKSYADESAAISDLATELSGSIYAPLVILLGIGDWVTVLKEANETFIELLHKRDAERAARAHPMLIARVPLQENILGIAERVEAVIVLYGMDFVPGLEPFVQEYNVIVRRYKHVLALERGHRKGRRAPDDDAGGVDDPEYYAPEISE